MLRRTSKTHIGWALAAGLLCQAPGWLWARQAESAGSESGEALSVDLSIGWASDYFFRGYLQEDGGSILQPGAELGIALVDREEVSLSLSLGTWSSFHSRGTGATADKDSLARRWFESDLYGGLSLGVQNWTFGVQFCSYSSPSGAFSSVDEITLSVGCDDSGLWGGDYGFNPCLLYAVETHDRGGPEDAYLEFGLAPSHSWELAGGNALTMEAPIMVGFSADDYYVEEDGSEEAVGYWGAGLRMTVDLPFPARFGSWSFTAGVQYLSMGDAATAANRGDGSRLLGSIGLSLSF